MSSLASKSDSDYRVVNERLYVLIKSGIFGLNDLNLRTPTSLEVHLDEVCILELFYWV